MGRALTAVGALLATAFAVLALELMRAIGERGEVDLRTLASFGWDRVLVVAPGTPRAAVSSALGGEFKGDLPFGSAGRLPEPQRF